MELFGQWDDAAVLHRIQTGLPPSSAGPRAQTAIVGQKACFALGLRANPAQGQTTSR
jgi:hypothetical protein